MNDDDPCFGGRSSLVLPWSRVYWRNICCQSNCHFEPKCPRVWPGVSVHSGNSYSDWSVTAWIAWLFVLLFDTNRKQQWSWKVRPSEMARNKKSQPCCESELFKWRRSFCSMYITEGFLSLLLPMTFHQKYPCHLELLSCISIAEYLIKSFLACKKPTIL